jgi:hypothetical protein
MQNDTTQYLQYLGQDVYAYIAQLKAKTVSQLTARQAQIVATVDAHYAQTNNWHEACIAYVREGRS